MYEAIPNFKTAIPQEFDILRYQPSHFRPMYNVAQVGAALGNLQNRKICLVCLFRLKFTGRHHLNEKRFTDMRQSFAVLLARLVYRQSWSRRRIWMSPY